jgi:CheY-like chemotaxis protein
MAAPNILVVDEQPINVQLLKRKLEREHAAVVTTHSGQEALAQVATEKPDLILLDRMMSDMDGIEVCRRLPAQESTRSIRVEDRPGGGMVATLLHPVEKRYRHSTDV